MFDTVKTVLLLLSSDQFSYPLIRYLVLEGRRYNWKICIGAMFDPGIIARIKEEKISNDLVFISITDFRQCDHVIRKADLVIGIVPDVMLAKLADSCLLHGTSLITPSRMTQPLSLRQEQADENNVLLLLECGFSPGMDHITAKKAIDSIHIRGGKVTEFKTYHGNVIAENCIDNPWGFKLTEPATDLISLGKQNNRHLINGHLQNIPYHQLFERSTSITIPGLRDIVAVPEGDSLYYRKIYELQEAATVVKGTLVRKGFDRIWNLLIQLGLTDTSSKVDMLERESFYHFLSSLLPYSPSDSLGERLKKYAGATREDLEKIKWLGLFDEKWIEGYDQLTPAILLQHLLEEKFVFARHDYDCILMKHELQYQYRNEVYDFTATMVAYGENNHDSAIAKGIGFTTGAAAKAFLLGDITVRGLHIPIAKEIYEPMLSELEDLGVAFHVEEHKVKDSQLNEVTQND